MYEFIYNHVYHFYFYLSSRRKTRNEHSRITTNTWEKVRKTFGLRWYSPRFVSSPGNIKYQDAVKNLACTREAGSLHLDGTREWTESVSAKIKSRTRWEGSAAGRLPYKLKLLFSTESFRDRLQKLSSSKFYSEEKFLPFERVSTTKAFHAFHTSSLSALYLQKMASVWSRVILFNSTGNERRISIFRIENSKRDIKFVSCGSCWSKLNHVRYSPFEIIRISTLSNTWTSITR